MGKNGLKPRLNKQTFLINPIYIQSCKSNHKLFYVELDIQRFRRRTTALSAAPPPPPPPAVPAVPPRRKCRRADALTQLRRGRSVESATGRSTAATAALLPRSRHSTTDDGGFAHGVARRGAARRRQLRTQARRLLKSLSTPLHCIIIGNSDELQKDEKRPKLCLNSVATSIIFTRRFTASLDHFSNISTIFSPHSLTGSSRKWIFLSQNTGRTEWLLTLSDRTPHMRIVMLILIYWAANQSQSRNTNIQFCWYTMIFPRLQPRQ